MKISGTVVGDREVSLTFDRVRDKSLPVLEKRIRRLAIKLQSIVMKNKLSGQALKVRTGTLRRSITQTVNVSGTAVTGIVGTNLEYAAIHEYGGVTRAHVIEAKHAAALRFVFKGEIVFRKRVMHPGSTMPMRSFLRSALDDMRQEIIRDLYDGVGEMIRS